MNQNRIVAVRGIREQIPMQRRSRSRQGKIALTWTKRRIYDLFAAMEESQGGDNTIARKVNHDQTCP